MESLGPGAVLLIRGGVDPELVGATESGIDRGLAWRIVSAREQAERAPRRPRPVLENRQVAALDAA